MITDKQKKDFADNVNSLIMSQSLEEFSIHLDLKQIAPTKAEDGTLWANHEPTGKIIITLQLNKKHFDKKITKPMKS